MKKQSSDRGFERRPDKGAIDSEGDMASNVSDSDRTQSELTPPQPPVDQSVIKLRDKNLFALSSQLSRNALNQLLPSSASVQLAQLHAQLTLHRLKLAQSAVNNNTAAASVLNHVLSKVAMSQPLFNTLRTSSMLSPTPGQPGGAQLAVGIPGKAIGPSGLQFSAQAPGLPPMLGGGMNLQGPNPASIRLNPFVGLAPGQPPTQPGDFSGKISDREYQPADETRHNQGFHQYGTPGKGKRFVHPASHPRFQSDFQVPPTTTGGHQPGCRMPGPGFPGDRNAGTFPQTPEVLRLMDSGGQGVWAPEQWHSSAPFAQPGGGHEYPARSDNSWLGKSHPLSTANDLYNPEEPTGDAKLNLRGAPLFNRFRNFPGPPYGQGDNHSHLMLERQLQPHELNDFHSIVPSQLPHICSICDKKVFNLKDWDQHVNGKHHIQNCLLFSETSDTGSSSFPRPANGSLNSGGISTDLPSDISQSHPTGTSTRTFLQSGTSFSSAPPGLKFPQRKAGPSRVVHICNIPEGSCTESDVINLGLPFGKVTNYILMRATSQAFLEMAYPEAAQAMVQFYQQKPPVFSEQQLLVRMSKQYKELKLKKPGKNVESIIHDINSQKEREVYKDVDRFPEERTRSRSPIARSSSPWMESHSPSFASCSSSQRSSISPRRNNQSPMATGRGERYNGTERRGSWEYLTHTGRREEEKEDSISRSYGEESRDRTDKWGHDRKQHWKSNARLSPKSLEDRGDGAQRQKDKYAKCSPIPFQAKYKPRNEEDYRKEYKLKSTRSQHSPRSKGKETEVPQRSGNRGSSTSQDLTENRSEHDRLKSPVHTNRLHRNIEKDEGKACDGHRQCKDDGGMSGSEAEEEEEEGNRCCSKESFLSPLSGTGSHELTLEQKANQQSPTWESGSETEAEGWYQCRMEEFVTVDEVGGEEEHSMEGEAEKLEINEGDSVEPKERRMEMSPEALVTKDMVFDWEKDNEDHCRVSSDVSRPMSPTLSVGSERISMESVSYSEITSDSIRIQAHSLSTVAEQQVDPEIDKGLSDGESDEHLEAAESQCKPSEGCDIAFRPQEQGHTSVEVPETRGTEQAVDGTSQDVVELHKVPPEALSKGNSSQTTLEFPGNNEQVSQTQQSQLPREQDNVFCNLSIPLGVEFVEPRTGFYCKLCGIFYITEEAAKTSHCRSTIHYKNLQRDPLQSSVDLKSESRVGNMSGFLHTEGCEDVKCSPEICRDRINKRYRKRERYLSQLAEDSLMEGEGDRNAGREVEVGIVPQFESKRSSPP